MSKNLLNQRLEDLEQQRRERKERKKKSGDAGQRIEARLQQLADRQPEPRPDPATVRAHIAEALPTLRAMVLEAAAGPMYPVDWFQQQKRNRKRR